MVTMERRRLYQERQAALGLCYRGDGNKATHGYRCDPCYARHLAAKRRQRVLPSSIAPIGYTRS